MISNSNKPLLTVKEAAEMFNINEKKIVAIVDATGSDLLLWNGNKRLIKADALREYLLNASEI